MYKGNTAEKYNQATGNNNSFETENLFYESVVQIDNFARTSDLHYLKKASEYLVKVLQFNPNHGQAYLCSSYIFYVLESYDLALKYFETGEKLLSDLPKQFSDFKEKLSNNVGKNLTPAKAISFDKIKYEPTKTVVNKNSSFWNVIKSVI